MQYTLRDDNINTPFICSANSISNRADDNEGGCFVTSLCVKCLHLRDIFAKVYTECEPNSSWKFLENRLETRVVGGLSHVKNPSDETDTHGHGDTFCESELIADRLDGLLQLFSGIKTCDNPKSIPRIRYCQRRSYQPRKVQNHQKQLLRL